jgi:hypothetical protein
MTAAIRVAYAALWATTASGAAIAVVAGWPWPVGAPHLALAATPATAVALVTHNLPVAVWPLGLVAIGWACTPALRRFGDGLITGQVVAHGLIVGGALGQQPVLWRYLPHLPVEWLAIAAPVGSWLYARSRADGTPNRRQLLAVAGVTLLATTVAAGAETFLTPITAPA